MKVETMKRSVAPSMLAGALIAASCGSGGGLTIEDPWARPTAPGAENAAFYMEISNSGDSDVLTGASSGRCTKTEVHATTMTDGVMSMAPATVEALIVSSDSSLVLEPGGVHVMCMAIKAPLIEGEVVTVELRFGDGDPITVDANVENRTG
jgi:copper(I)-binding protein